MEISIARALTELKTLDSRIQNKIGGTNFIAGVKKSSKKVNNIYTRDEFNTDVVANYQSIVDLIKRRKVIKSAIVNSNAITKVTIADIEYTVADAIERKNSIELDKTLLIQLESQYRNVITSVDRNNEAVEQNLQNLLTASVGADKKASNDTTLFAEAYRNQNSFEVVNPLKLQEKIEVLRKEIEDFETEVDVILTESNVITKIEIED
ncbi:hypothetical protein [Clostridium sp.]|uniref:hypothetical protein n=1 Tax=Clostridium sp. TaxID=1506 RepID=UPI0026361D0A|nr:hypothetical protein [Clostridium sp.]